MQINVHATEDRKLSFTVQLTEPASSTTATVTEDKKKKNKQTEAEVQLIGPGPEFKYCYYNGMMLSAGSIVRIRYTSSDDKDSKCEKGYIRVESFHEASTGTVNVRGKWFYTNIDAKAPEHEWTPAMTVYTSTFPSDATYYIPSDHEYNDSVEYVDSANAPRWIADRMFYTSNTSDLVLRAGDNNDDDTKVTSKEDQQFHDFLCAESVFVFKTTFGKTLFEQLRALATFGVGVQNDWVMKEIVEGVPPAAHIAASSTGQERKCHLCHQSKPCAWQFTLHHDFLHSYPIGDVCKERLARIINTVEAIRKARSWFNVYSIKSDFGVSQMYSDRLRAHMASIKNTMELLRPSQESELDRTSVSRRKRRRILSDDDDID